MTSEENKLPEPGKLYRFRRYSPHWGVDIGGTVKEFSRGDFVLVINSRHWGAYGGGLMVRVAFLHNETVYDDTWFNLGEWEEKLEKVEMDETS